MRPALLRLKAMGVFESASGAEQSPRICAQATASLRPSHELGCLQEQVEDVLLKAQQQHKLLPQLVQTPGNPVAMLQLPENSNFNTKLRASDVTSF